jgi:predicted metal-dependent phosphotriesterase family hydrolase
MEQTVLDILPHHQHLIHPLHHQCQVLRQTQRSLLAAALAHNMDAALIIIHQKLTLMAPIVLDMFLLHLL